MMKSGREVLRKIFVEQPETMLCNVFPLINFSVILQRPQYYIISCCYRLLIQPLILILNYKYRFQYCNQITVATGIINYTLL